MLVANDVARIDAEKPKHVVQCGLKGPLCFERAHVADVLAEVSETALRYAEGSLQFCPNGQQIIHWLLQHNRKRSIAPGSPKRNLLVFECADHGVVADHLDFAIMNQKSIGNAMQPGSR